MRKTGNPFWGAYKIARVSGIVGWHYANSVNNQRAREGSSETFEALPRKWGVRGPGALVEHKGSHYVELKVEKSLDYDYYSADGVEIESDDLAPYLPTRRESSRQKTEKAIILRDYKVDNLISITYNGVAYAIK